MNLSVLDEWIITSGLPQGIDAHFAPVRELLHWLQVSGLLFNIYMLDGNYDFSLVPIFSYGVCYTSRDYSNDETS